jgi:hypothetical protein
MKPASALASPSNARSTSNPCFYTNCAYDD